MSNIDKNNQGGLQPQVLLPAPGGSARAGAINAGNESVDKQMSLIKGGKKIKIIGGTGSSGSSPSPITPPTVPNTGVSNASYNSQQSSYNKLAELSGSVNENSKYDSQIGGSKKKYKLKKYKLKKYKSKKYKLKKYKSKKYKLKKYKSKKYKTKRRKYH